MSTRGVAGWAAAVVLAVAALFGGYALGDRSGSDGDHPPSAATPGDTSPEAGFTRDMSTHHAQAVDLAERIRFRTSDEDLQRLATDIVLTQQSQIGRFDGWLEQWGLPATSATPPMSWAGDEHGDDHGEGGMPGMATPAEAQALSTLPLDEAEISFLELMIAHHRGGVEMAEAVLALTERSDVTRIATAIVNGQTSEIEAMQRLLAARSG